MTLAHGAAFVILPVLSAACAHSGRSLEADRNDPRYHRGDLQPPAASGQPFVDAAIAAAYTPSNYYSSPYVRGRVLRAAGDIPALGVPCARCKLELLPETGSAKAVAVLTDEKGEFRVSLDRETPYRLRPDPLCVRGGKDSGVRSGDELLLTLDTCP